MSGLVDSTSVLVDSPKLTESPTVGEKFTVSISILTSVDLHHFDFNLSFDPALLRVEGVEYGEFLNLGDKELTTNGTPVIDNDAGLINKINAQRNTKTGITGLGNLIKINFKAVGVGVSKLQIQNPSFIQSTDQSLVLGEIPTTTITVLPVRGQIWGRVRTGSGLPVHDVKVEAFLAGKQIGTSAETNFQGEYLIDHIYQAGLVEVRASAAGFLPIPSIEVGVTVGSKTESADLVTIPTTAFQSVTDYRGFIRNWLLLGAIDWEDKGTGLMSDQLNPKTKPGARFPVQETEFKEIDPKDGDFGTGLAKDLRWTLHVDPQSGIQRRDHRIRTYELYPDREQAVVYAFTHVKAAVEMRVNMELEHGGVAVWLNGELIHIESEDRCCWDPDTSWQPDVVKGVSLKKGWNSILIKTSRGEFSCRFTSQSSLFGAAEPWTNLLVSPQLGATTTSQPQPAVSTGGTFKLKLEPGLNMISMPVKPDQPMTSKTLAKELDASLVIRLDPKEKVFVPFVPEHFEGSNFPIEGGMGLIVNVKRSQTSTFTGSVWDNTAAAPIVHWNVQSVWAFGLVFERLPVNSPVRIRNLRTGETAQTSADTPAIAFVDQSQQSVVHPQDWLEIQTEDTRWRYQVTGKDLRQAFAVVTLNERIQIPNQTRLLQNYPNPFNPETWMPIELSQDTEVSVTIYDVQGKRIRQLQLGLVTAGRYVTADRAVYWDGKTETGEQVASGVYFYTIQAGELTDTRKMLLMK
ncbi:MAG: FlgD immunoglobulin-like domain containing protein [Candidatus Poribacteria bacterium]|nr:FlgD immunoglobulin-like domain containing protein [Candidatus Poribacteria bacterium]